MGETTIVRDAVDAPGDVVNGLAASVGALTNEAKHHAESLAQHAERLTNIEGDTTWIRTRLDELGRMATDVPSSAIADLRSELAAFKMELEQQMAALSEAIVPQTTDEPQTDPPPPAPNPAADPDKSGPLGGLRKALHRLL